VTAQAVTVTQCMAWIRGFADLVAKQKDLLTELDAAIGDADHGINMDRGMRAVCDKLEQTAPGEVDQLFKLVGMTLVSNVGGASGPLYGTFFLRLAAACGPRQQLSLDEYAKAWRAGVEGLVGRGRPELGDKTMFDSLHPGLAALDAAVAAGEPAHRAFRAAWTAAEEGRDATVPMVARKGRASYLGERSAGHQDPGATSASLLFEAAAAVFSGLV
jgi:phosphoenolpyruvate---glycerone phosphotransferase subunit DhaL